MITVGFAIDPPPAGRSRQNIRRSATMTNRSLYFNGLRQYLAGFGGFDPVNSLTGSGPADR
jgi:hypothetical protein